MKNILRIGSGIDVHPLVSGRQLILGGIDINHNFGCDGHSDGDVLTHSIIDAILGALNKGDIGDHFPSSDKNYQGASSLNFLDIIYSKYLNNKWDIINIDSTVLLQAPTIKPYIKLIKTKLSQHIPFTSEDNISIKATTTDHLGFIGDKKGIAAFTTCLLTTTNG